jgi:hypothetical protein
VNGARKLVTLAGRSGIDTRPLRRIGLTILAAVAALTAFCGAAQAASPAWKLLAVTGPTNLPPTQSAVQRATVEASGGTFTLEKQTAEAEGTLSVHFASAKVVEGSNIAEVEFAFEPFTIGERVSAPAFPAATVISGISGSAEEPVLELSSPATLTEPAEFLTISSNVVTGVSVFSGAFNVGDEVTGEFVPSGTTVTAVGNGTLTLSDYPVEPAVVLLTGTETTAPIAFDAESETVQRALEALPSASPNAFSVSGGPGGDTDHPYFISFGGALGNQPVASFSVGASGLEGANHAAQVVTVVPGGPGTGKIAVMPANVGSLPSSGLVEMTLGPLPKGVVTSGQATGQEGVWDCPGGAGESLVVCTSEAAMPALNVVNGIEVPIEVRPEAEARSVVPVTISGGGAGAAAYQMPIVVSSEQASFGVQAFWAGAFDSEGVLSTQAAGHPANAAAYFLLNTVRSLHGQIIPAGDPKNVRVDLPPGFIGNPMITPRCPQSQLSNVSGPLCTPEMSVGTFNPILSEISAANPPLAKRLYNDVPASGYAAEFTSVIGSPEVSVFASVRSKEDFGVSVAGLNISTYDKIYGAYTGLEGIPAGAGGRAFLTNASACSENARQAPTASLSGESWQGISFLPVTQTLPAVSKCNLLEFTPSLTVRPTTTQGSSGTGATARLQIPQASLLDPSKLAQPDLKKAVVSLPAGMTLNPSSANGLEACSEVQMGYLGEGKLPNPDNFDENAPNCPDGSKLGTVEVTTPLLEDDLQGTIYLAEQEKNPFGSLIGLYLAIESPRFGLQIKLAGKVELDPDTGQLTATFDNNPQVPFAELKLNFRGGGPRSELATPEVCGHYSTTGSLEPWSAPDSGPAEKIQEAGFDVGSNCASSADKRPFAPSFEAGTTGTQAGAYSPLVVKVGRKDGEQELKTLDFTLPKGLLAKLAGIPYCPESAIQEAEHRSGKAEQASASCPAASRIGSVDTAAGVGSEPFHVGGSVYLAGPYKGAPLSSVVVSPAVAGPFDLGDVVVRAPLYVNPETAEVTAKSDPIPTILKGIPLKVRSVAINLDRPSFALNPTSCNVMMATASIGGSSGGTAKPSNRFQVGGCKQLKFKPNLKISLKGATKRTGLPALKAVVTYPKKGAYANIQRAQVNLPHSEFLEQNNLNKTCTKPILLEGKCSKTSIYGRAKAWSPLLDKPLEGPVYLVGGYGYKLPALVADLNGQIRVLLVGKVDSGPNRGIRATFEMVPDAPVSRFVLEMKGGKKYGLLINSEGLCGNQQRANSLFRAQNGLVQQAKPLIANQCGKKSKKKGSKGHGGKKS